MANKGNLYLDNGIVINLYDVVKAYEPTVQQALYSHYKNTYKISVSNYFRGDAADSFKNYITNCTINIIAGLLDLSSDVTMFIQLLAETFYAYEKNHNGRVEECVLDYIDQTINAKEILFNDSKSELNEVLRLASDYITPKELEVEAVNVGYSDTRKLVKKLREDLYAADDEALSSVNELMERIIQLRTFIENTMKYCYNDDGRINTDHLSTIQYQNWFQTNGTLTLYLMLEEDPFEYAAGEVTLSEEQWAVGLCSDVYAYAGYSFLSASGEAGIEDETAFAKGKATLLSANGYAQFTDYLNAQANINLLYGEGEAKVGWSDKYAGFKVQAEVGVVQADGSIVIGTSDINAFVKGEVKVLCADGKVAFEFEDDGQFAIGVDASATAASASVKAGTSFFNYRSKDTATGKEESLLGFQVGAKADAGGSFAIWAESKTALEMEHININATTIKITASAVLGADFSVTVPTVYIKWPW